jgi:tRNA (cytidine/uridine-2'-O-)-methyltransferase
VGWRSARETSPSHPDGSEQLLVLVVNRRSWRRRLAPLDADLPECYSKGVLYEPRLHIVLHQPEIPPNTGAVGRTCVALAAKLWLVRPLGFRIDEKTLRRAGLDYWQHLEWEVVDDWAALERMLPLERAWYFTKSARHSFWNVQYSLADILVFGCETAGLPPSILERYRERTLRIPTRPEVRSLNLSNSVAIAAYEASRQFLVGGEGLPLP